jgi:hypothetical protein
MSVQYDRELYDWCIGRVVTAMDNLFVLWPFL